MGNRKRIEALGLLRFGLTIIMLVAWCSTAEAVRYPLNGTWTVTQDFCVYNSSWGGYHLGEDVVRSAEDPVYAPAAGTIRHAAQRTGYGYVSIIESSVSGVGTVCFVMGHLRQANLLPVGTVVSEGQLIGYLSDDYNENGGYNFAHVHFAVHKNAYSSSWIYWGYQSSSSECNNWYDPTNFVNSYSNSITVTNPNGGNYWYMNQQYNITWTTSGTVGNVLIHLYQGSPPNGTFRQAITASTANDGVYEWTVFPWLDLASNYYIGIAETDGDPSDFSNSPFSIGPGLGVTTPNGGQTWYYNQTYNIQWESYPSYGSVGNVQVHLYQGSAPHGTYNRTIAAGTTNDGTLEWTIPCDIASGSNYYIGIAETDGNPSDFSNSPFTITGSNPAAPSNLSASDTRCDGVQLTWTDNSTWETEYRVYRSSSLISTLPANTTSYLDTPSPGAYSYYVTAAYPCGASGPSNTDNGTRLATPTQATGVSATDNGCTNVVVMWNDLSGESGYYIYRDGGQLGSVGANVTSYTDNTTTPYQVYSYRVAGYNACGTGSQSNSDNGSRISTPAQVSGVSATDSRCNDVVITWSNTTGESGYYIYCNGSQIGSVGTDVTTYTDTPSPGTYNYSVAAYNSCGAGSQSSTDSGTRLSTPAQVINVAATDNSCTDIVVTWTDISGEAGYYVYRDGSQVGSVGSNVTTYSDAPAPGTYGYSVAAYNTCGVGATSSTDPGTRLPAVEAPSNCLATDNGCSNIIITWNDNSEGETGFRVYRDASLHAQVGANMTMYTDTPSPGTYNYSVRAYSACGESDPSNTESGTRLDAPAAPSGCMASDTGCSGILISWVDNSANESGFIIYRDGGTVATIGSNVTSYYDTPPSGIYSYSVKAENNCGLSGSSNSDSGTRLTAAAPPSNCQASDTSCSAIIVTWQDNSDNETGFRIYRNGGLVGSVSANVTFFYNFPASGMYSYTVRAYTTACGNSEASSPDNGTRLTLPAAPISLIASDTSTIGVYLVWQDTTSNEAGFAIYRDLVYVHTTNADVTSYLDYPGDQLEYEYCVKAVNNCGDSGSACDIGQVVAGIPIPADFVIRVESGWLRLDWKAVRYINGDLIPNVLYNIYRSDAPSITPSPSTLRAATQDTMYVDLPDVSGGIGFYVVTAEQLPALSGKSGDTQQGIAVPVKLHD